MIIWLTHIMILVIYVCLFSCRRTFEKTTTFSSWPKSFYKNLYHFNAAFEPHFLAFELKVPESFSMQAIIRESVFLSRKKPDYLLSKINRTFFFYFPPNFIDKNKIKERVLKKLFVRNFFFHFFNRVFSSFFSAQTKS